MSLGSGSVAALARAEDLLHACDFPGCVGVAEASRNSPHDPAGEAELALVAMRAAAEVRDFESAARWEARARAAAARVGEAELPLRVDLAGASVSLVLGAKDVVWQQIEEVRLAMRGLESPSQRMRFEFHRSRSHAHASMGHQQEALEEGERALQAARGWRGRRAVASALGNVAGRWFALGFRQRQDGLQDEALRSLTQAVELGAQAVAEADAVGSRLLNLANLNNLCGAAAALGDAARARDAHARLERLSDEAGVHLHLVHAAIHIARLLQRERRDAEALELIRRESARAQAIQARRADALLNLVASEIHEAAGAFREALAAYKAYDRSDESERGESAETLSRVIAVRERAEADRAEADALRVANAELAQQALSDPLTGIANRRRFDAALLDALAAATPEGAGRGCLAVVDADHFKRVNDQHSHAVGDRVLQALARLLIEQCRHSDLAARWGGEEFALLLPGVDLPTAAAVCERLRAAVERHAWAALSPGLAVTVSIGLAPLVAGADAKIVLERGDQALYRAKREGRNRVCVAPASPD